MQALFPLNKNHERSTHIQAVKELISRLLVLQEQFKVLKNLKNEEQNMHFNIFVSNLMT